jgi:hypothetical protein
LTFELCADALLVRAIITHPSIFPFMFSDGGPTPEAFELATDERAIYILVSDEAGPLGLFICARQTSVCWEAHACLLPAARGKKAIEVYRGFREWLGKNTPCRKVIGYTPETNKAALYVARRAGMEVIGINRRSIMLDGQLRDQFILGGNVDG